MFAKAGLAFLLSLALETPPHRTSFSSFAGDTVASCVADARRSPRSLLPPARLLRLALVPETRTAALAALERLATGPRASSQARLYLGMARLKLGDRTDAERLLREAAVALQGEGDRIGETYARVYLEVVLRLGGRASEASGQLIRAQALARELEDPILVAYAQVLEAWEVEATGDYGRARSLFESAKDVLATGPNGYLESLAWEGIANVAITLGQYREALDAETARVAALQRDGGPVALAKASLANRAFYLADLGDFPWSDVDRLIAEAITESERAHAPNALRGARYLRALRMGTSLAAEREMVELRGNARLLGDRYGEAVLLWRLGQLRARLHPEQLPAAEQLITEALDLSRDEGYRDQMAFALTARALLRWQAERSDEALADTDAALRIADWDRDRQAEDSVRIGVQSQIQPVDLLVPLVDRGVAAQAFDVTERMRARVLLERLREERGTVQLPPELRRRREELRVRLVRLQTDLVDGRLGADGLLARRAELEHAEREERQLDDEIAHRTGLHVARQGPLRLGQIQQLLAPDEALLSYVVVPDGHADEGDLTVGSRSFLQVVTRASVRTLRIPGQETIAPAVELYLGLIRARSPAEPEASAGLYRRLLSAALDGLGPEIHRLILLASGPLHALPFEALRPSPGAPPLGTRYAVTHSPSATTWAVWRTGSPRTPRAPLLALADPGTSRPATPGFRTSSGWLDGLQLRTLPAARAEATEAARLLGGGSQVLVGSEATEHALKTLPLRSWSILHVAAHAVADDDVPTRSAVVLAPGSPGEDGLLQMRDVPALDLQGMMVVLAACRSATGAVSRGEGTVGLSRSFLAAGARAVVVSLWELGDDASLRFFREFYRELAAGRPAQESLRLARLALIRDGAPAADWAGILLIGDGDFSVLVPPPAPSKWVPWISLAIVGAAVAFLARHQLRAAKPAVAQPESGPPAAPVSLPVKGHGHEIR